MSVLSEYNDILSKKDKVIAKVAIELFNELVDATPKITGFLKASWQPPKKKDDGYVISNTALYADIILHERMIIRGKQYGSLQFPDGIDNIILKWEKIMQQELNKI